MADVISKIVRVLCFSGYYGDDLVQAAASIRAGLRQGVKYFIGDYLAELTIGALYKGKQKGGGYALTFNKLIIPLLEEILDHNAVIIVNAGGLDPLAAARSFLKEAGPLASRLKVAVVHGDNVLDTVRSTSDASGYDGMQSYETVRSSLRAANAYFGAKSIVEALKMGANVIIAGRCCDASLAVAPAIFEHGWSFDDFDQIAGATVAGHIIECGAHATGGNYGVVGYKPSLIPDAAHIGHPIAEIESSGEFVVTLPQGLGGLMNRQTVLLQLIYEIVGAKYPTADVIADLSRLMIQDHGNNRVRVTGAVGHAPTMFLKVALTYLAGARMRTTADFTGPNAWVSAREAGHQFEQALVERGIPVTRMFRALTGIPKDDLSGLASPAMAEGAGGTFTPSASIDVGLYLRLLEGDAEKNGADTERALKSAASLFSGRVLNGPPFGSTYEPGSVQAVYGNASMLIPRSDAHATVALFEGNQEPSRTREVSLGSGSTNPVGFIAEEEDRSSATHVREYSSYFEGAQSIPLSSLVVVCRSGDKGAHANVGMVAKSEKAFELLHRYLTAEVVLSFTRSLNRGFEQLYVSACDRYAITSLHALNFVLKDVLGEGGGGCNPNPDNQGKGLGGDFLYALHVPVPNGEEVDLS